jgi:hypothetical protein
MKNPRTKVTIELYGSNVYCHRGSLETETNEKVEKLYLNICKYFKKRGFNIGRDEEVFKQYPSIAKGHKYGIKNGLEFNSEPTGAGFKFDFYQNIVFENSNGGKYDFDKYQKMPYRIKLTYRNEMLRLAKYLESKDVEVFVKVPLTDIEKIIESDKQNTHIHGKNINCLDDIRVYMESESGSYNRNYNSKDKNGKQITCGEVKYFYDYYTKRLSRGIVYHHINNMWWVLVHGKSYNKASFDLFDLSPEIPTKKVLNKEAQINRMEKQLRLLESKRLYDKCIILDKSIKKLKGSENTYRVWSIKHGAFWGANNTGYTQQEELAGIYLEKNIFENKDYYDDGINNKAILIK